MALKNKVIINCSIGSDTSWYHRGQDRLKESLFNQNSFLESEIYFTRRHEPETGNVYEDKIKAVKEAAEKGYTQLLWLDCSITAIRPLDDIWNWIGEKGYYLYESGYNCAQTSNDDCLKYYGVSRNLAEKMHECASNVVGFNLSHKRGRELFDEWVISLTSTANRGIKWPSAEERLKESSDSRFQFHRQDQSTLSLAAGILGLALEKHNHFVFRAESDHIMNESVIFKLKGGVDE